MFGNWVPGSKEKSSTAVVVEQESGSCGGTAHILPNERQKASFDVLQLTYVIDGGPKQTARRRWIWSEGQQFDNTMNYYLDREALVSQHVKRFLELHSKFTETFMPSPGDIMMMGNASRNGMSHTTWFSLLLIARGCLQSPLRRFCPYNY